MLANLDRSEEEVFLIKLPKELAEALHARGEGLEQGRTRRVGTMTLDAAGPRAPKAFTLTHERDAQTKRTYKIKAPLSSEALRVFAHERTEEAPRKGRGEAGGRSGGGRGNPVKRPFRRPEPVAFRGVVTCSGTALLETAKDEDAFLELAKKLQAKGEARKREAKKRKLGRADGKSLAAAQMNLDLVTSKSVTAGGAVGQLRKTQGLKDQSAARLPKRVIERAIFEAFEQLPPEANGGMKLPEIKAIAKLRYQKETWIKAVAELCDCHGESGKLHARAA